MKADEVVALGAARALSKPFKRSELLGAVAELLPSQTADCWPAHERIQRGVCAPEEAMRQETQEEAIVHFVEPRATDVSETAARGTDRLIAAANILDLTHDAVFGRSMASVVQYWNRAAEQLYGWTSDEAIGV